MRVSDARHAINDGLNELEWHRYLRAMWLILREFQARYSIRPEHQSYVSRDHDPLMDETLDIVRQAAVEKTITETVVDSASEIWLKWELLKRRYNSDYADVGQLRVWRIFGALAGEVAGASRKYLAGVQIDMTMRDLWQEESEPRINKMWINNPNEEAADDSDRARALARVVSIVAAVADTEEPDPARIAVPLREHGPDGE